MASLGVRNENQRTYYPLPCFAEAEHGGSFKQLVDNYCRDLIEDAMRQSGGNQAEAARLLGLTYHQFRHYHRKYRQTDVD